ncbi:MAG: AprI/Inh family metalloprotease inhibitor [Phreatobacter sp.]|nr:AprI/Inh family metalloprotease inhibitor [Phreatobacter sp.]
MIRAALTLLVMGFGLPAGAQGIDPGILRSLAGTWLVAPADGAPGCRITLATTQAIGGYGLTVSPACAQRVPAIANAAAWSPVEGISLIDPARRTLLRFRENEDASYSAMEPAPGFVLVKAPEGTDRVPNARDAFGDWVLRRPDGEVVCRLHLSDRPPPGGQESYAVRVPAQGCQPAVTRLRLASWRIEAPKLVLYGLDGNSLSFLLTATGFTKDPAEGGRPLLMERAP